MRRNKYNLLLKDLVRCFSAKTVEDVHFSLYNLFLPRHSSGGNALKLIAEMQGKNTCDEADFKNASPEETGVRSAERQHFFDGVTTAELRLRDLSLAFAARMKIAEDRAEVEALFGSDFVESLLVEKKAVTGSPNTAPKVRKKSRKEQFFRVLRGVVKSRCVRCRKKCPQIHRRYAEFLHERRLPGTVSLSLTVKDDDSTVPGSRRLLCLNRLSTIRSTDNFLYKNSSPNRACFRLGNFQDFGKNVSVRV